MKLVKLRHQIYAVEVEDSIIVAEMFMRMQEYYESPKFRGKLFKLKDYRKWYMKSKNKSEFTYSTDWTGFNVPSYAVRKLIKGHFPDPLNGLELWLKRKLESRKLKGRFYLIGYSKNNASVKDHEIAHGLYYTNDSYKLLVNRILKDIDLKTDPIALFLMGYGYHKSVILDEIHAWLMCDFNFLVEQLGFSSSQWIYLKK